MKFKILNNRRKKRAFSNGLFLMCGPMFPFINRKFITVGLFGFIVTLNY